MKTRSAKSKGRRLQKLVSEKILETFPHLTANDVFSAISGESGIDVKLSEGARKVFPFAVECKNQERPSIWAAIRQSREHATDNPGLTPLVIICKNHETPYVIVDMDTFFELVNTHHGVDGTL